MVAKAIWVTILAIGVLSVSGLGFAAFTAAGTATTSGTGGSLSLAWDNSNSQVSATYVTCGTAIVGSNLWANVTDLAPGDWCVVFGNITNTGTVGASISVSDSVSNGFHSCFAWDQISNSKATVSAGGTYAWEGAIELNTRAGNSCQGATGTVTTSITATARTAETSNEPSGL
ncbi:MAG: hypothetical protein ACYDFT_02145 [Thermoplasmata archaeon]